MPIHIGFNDSQKKSIITDYIISNDIVDVFIISPEKFRLTISQEHTFVSYKNSIEYKYFYMLLQRINQNSLVVVNECLRTQNRYDLTYNCIRNFLNQTEHQLIFNQLPQIDTREDFMTLFDFDTQSRWKREEFNIDLIASESSVFLKTPHIQFNMIKIPTTQRLKEKYTKRKLAMFNDLGARDPHIIPRRLYLMSGSDKKAYVENVNAPLFSMNEPQYYIARNQRLRSNYIDSYNSFDKSKVYSILEFQHRFIDFTDFMREVWQFEFDVITTELNVDQWYFNRYKQWGERVNETCAKLHG